MNTSQVGRTSHKTIPRGSARDAAPQHQNLLTQAPRRGTYRVPRQQTHGARLRMLTPMMTPTIPQDLGIQGIENELSCRMSGISPSPSSTTMTSKPEQIDASPPYFAREALAIPRAQFGHHSPAYDTRVTDPFAALRRNTIPFPTTRRNQILPVPFRQWPDESDTSESSSESDRGRRRQRGSNASNAWLEESVPHLDHSTATDPFNVEGPDYEWNSLVQIDREILGPERVEAWELRRADVETRTDWQHRESGRTWTTSSPPAGEHPSTSAPPTDGELMARVHANRNRELYRTHPSR